MDYVCRFCNQTFNFEKQQQFAAHSSTCQSNPNRKQYKKSKYTFKCLKCSTNFELILTKTQFDNSIRKRFCSVQCRNSHKINDEQKNNIRVGMLNSSKIIRKPKFEINCSYPDCKKIFKTTNPNRKYCSLTCSSKHITPSKRKALSVMGRKSAEIMAKTRRSKNEILFAQKCEELFQNVTTNKRIFNGWDADVIIHDHKLAILWNGKWHYEKITKKHSLKQVQKRDEIKINEIKKKGFIPYVIKDMGKFDENKVNKEFNKLIEYIKANG